MLPKEGSRGRSEADKPPVHGPSGYQPAITIGCSAAVAVRSQGAAVRSEGVRARLGVRALSDAPPLGGRQPLLVRFPEPGQGDRTEDGKAEPQRRNPAQAGA